ncbi:hypothetical protein NX059_005955 [Plenodomus lindquistii]|nr:hypothetical protein NX059_005955 [Plenodomus lindquistii]
MTAPNNIILYGYDFSPFTKRITTYLAMRGIEYAYCQQPMTMPRPDLTLIPVAYRMIPFLAIGKDIYLDTRLVLRKLELLFPGTANSPTLGATKPQDAFLQNLLQRYIIEGPVFGTVAGLVPAGVAADTTFIKDRAGFLGRTWAKEELEEGRGDCIAYVKGLCGLFEETVFSDGRKWVLGGEKPSLADIEAVWPLDFCMDLPMPAEVQLEKQFPKTAAWIARYRASRDEAKSSAPKPTMLEGQAAAEMIHRSEYAESDNVIDGDDALGLAAGIEVEVYPAAWGSEHRDRGRLVGLTKDEVTISVQSKGGAQVRIHAPRTGFKIRATGRN